MCGIAGIVGPHAEESAVRSMVGAMSHRGPDGRGFRSAPSQRCVLGHARLAILDTSEAGRQPMGTPDGRYWIAYNGEVYNHGALRARLQAQGERFSTSTDTEVVLRWLALQGAGGLSDLRGMFALALWDEREQVLLLARDSLGVKPLYVMRRLDGSLAFASEVRALLGASDAPRRVNPQGLLDYLSLGFVLEPDTIVQGVRSLAAGTFLGVDGRGQELRQGLFREAFPSEPGVPVTPQEVRESFERAVRAQLMSDVPLGAFLSGGVDSSAIVGAMTAVPGQRVETLTVSFPDEPAWDESERAGRWARACGAVHHEVPMTGAAMLSLVPEAMACQDQPTVDAVNTLVVSKAAREAGLTVVLSGLGGDELFGGYGSFRQVPRARRMRRALGPVAAVGAGVLRLGDRRWDARRAKLVDLLEGGSDIASVYGARRRLFTARQAQRLWPEAPVRSDARRLAAGQPAGLEARDAICWLESTVYMRNQLLRDADAMGMACSLEIRPPFLDEDLVALAWRAGPSWRDGKRRLVGALGTLGPGDVLDHAKRGFTMPFDAWLRGPLRKQVHERLLALPPPFDAHAVGELWARFEARPTRVGWARPWALFVLSGYLARHRLAL